MQNRDKLHKKAKSAPESATLRITYKRYRNFCNNILKKVKDAYEKEQLKSAQNNNKELWKAIKHITNTTKTTQHPKELLTLSNSPEQSLHEANTHFINVGSSLAEKTYSRNTNTHNMFTQNTFTKLPNCTSNINSFVMMDTDENEVNNIIIGLKADCAPGGDKISCKFLKQHSNVLVPHLTKIFNDCLKHGIFPDSLKRSEVCPIYKNGDRSRINNYRPISILPALSKILEKIINVRLAHYLETNDLLSPNQFGFRHGKGTEQAVNKLISFTSANMSNGKKCLTIFLDLAKAFDTISVSILLDKLELLGVRGVQLELFKSYLSGRSQCVRVGKYKSTYLPVTHGVPQGSVLGPTLFLVYINELTKLRLAQGEIVSFADDTALAFTGSTWDEVFDAAQRGFNTVRGWLHQNILTLNVDKTKYICFSIRHDIKLNKNLNIIPHECVFEDSCNCSSLERVKSIKYLGVTIDCSLNFKEHVKHMCGRVRKLIYIFKKLRHIAEPKLMKQIYFALCQSLLTYCITTWGGTAKTTIKSIEVAQRAVLKVSISKPICFPTTTLFQICEVLTVRQLFILNMILLQHSRLTYNPELLNKRRKYMVCNTPTHSKTQFISKFADFIGPYLYNKINKSLNIYPLTKTECKAKLHNYLQKLSYVETELLLNKIQ